MKVLVLVADYPDPKGGVALYYVHTRNRYYISNHIDVTVLNFATDEDYTIDEISVISLRSYVSSHQTKRYDILICHAANLRNHLLFILKYHRLFARIVFFFHGHEVLRYSQVYPKPYPFVKTETPIKLIAHDCYDLIKLRIWRSAYTRLAHKSWFVFVSKWMCNEFTRWVGIKPAIIDARSRIIPNSVGELFETQRYERDSPKVYDFVTIRNSLDGSKYCIDVVSRAARSSPDLQFCIAGKGDYFRFNVKPPNVTLIERQLHHSEIVHLLNQSRCALLPTRTDAQGVMACETATFGIPLITSDIPVCKEMLREFTNVGYIDNDASNLDLRAVMDTLEVDGKKNTTYFRDNTCGEEVRLFRLTTQEVRL